MENNQVYREERRVKSEIEKSMFRRITPRNITAGTTSKYETYLRWLIPCGFSCFRCILVVIQGIKWVALQFVPGGLSFIILHYTKYISNRLWTKYLMQTILRGTVYRNTFQTFFIKFFLFAWRNKLGLSTSMKEGNP